MELNLRKLIDGLAAPVLMLGFGVLVASKPELLPMPVVDLLPHVPWLVAISGALLGWWFNASRVFFSMAIIAAGDWVLVSVVAGTPQGDVAGQVVYAALAILLPVNLAVFAFLEERGVATRYGLWRAGFVLAQVLIVAFASGALGILDAANSKALADGVADLLHFRVAPHAYDMWTYLPQLAIFTNGAAVIALMIRFVALRQHMDAGSLGAVMATGAGLHTVGQGILPSIFFTIAALILIVAVARDAYRMAFHDELTGMASRRGLTTAMKALPSRYVIAMADVDHFKKFNDTHGHDVGDQVLQMVAGRLEAVTGGGRAFRYGGEEFTILFAGRDIDEVWDDLEDVREAVANSHFAIRGKARSKSGPASKPAKAPGGKQNRGRRKTVRDDDNTVRVTISIGVADAQDAATPEGVIKAADEALYRAKEGGRNQVSD